MTRAPTASTFAALRSREFRLLWSGLGVSGVGGAMQELGLGWLVVQLAVADGVPHLAPLYLGLVGLSRAVPGIVSGLFAGVIADRMDRRRLLILSQSAGCVISSALAALTFTDRIGLVPIMALAALAAATSAVDLPSRQAMLPRVVPRSELLSAIGLNNAGLTISMLVGPLIAGLLIGPIGVAGLMAVNAVTFAAAVAALIAMRPLPPLDVRPEGGMFRSLGESVRYVVADPVLRWVVGMSVLMSLFARPYPQMLPAVAQDTLGVGPVELSWLLAASAVGTLGGSLLTASLGSVQRRGLVLAASVVGLGIGLVLFAAQRELIPALVLVVLPGLSLWTFSGMAFSIAQTRPPDHVRGRVVSLYVTSFTGIIPLGSLVLGSLGALTGISGALAIGGAMTALLGVFALARAATLRGFRASAPAWGRKTLA